MTQLFGIGPQQSQTQAWTGALTEQARTLPYPRARST